MVLVTVALSYVALFRSPPSSVAQHGVWSLLNLSNIYLWRNVGGYWGESAASIPLLHTWSLAIEEQFYLFFPVALLLLSRRRRLCSMLSLIALASFAVGAYLTRTHQIAAFYLLPTRAWELLAGAALGAYRVPAMADQPLKSFNSARLLKYVGWGGLALIVAGFFSINEGSNFPGLHRPRTGNRHTRRARLDRRGRPRPRLVPRPAAHGPDRQAVVFDLPLALAADRARQKLRQPQRMAAASRRARGRRHWNRARHRRLLARRAAASTPRPRPTKTLNHNRHRLRRLRDRMPADGALPSAGRSSRLLRSDRLLGTAIQRARNQRRRRGHVRHKICRRFAPQRPSRTRPTFGTAAASSTIGARPVRASS